MQSLQLLREGVFYLNTVLAVEREGVFYLDAVLAVVKGWCVLP